MRSGKALLLMFLAIAGIAHFAACDGDAVAQPCTNIPVGGCPRSRGVACEDPSCEAVYLCRPNNVWEIEQRCPPRPPRDAAPPTADAGQVDPLVDASIDAPPGAFGGPGCATLQSPDCALGLALACGGSCCGCEDLFVCEDGAWTLWGACADGGIAEGR